MQTEIDLESRLEELPDLLPFPAVATKLMNVANSSSVSIRDMCRIIECDASLSMELLRIANSPIYGCGGQVRTIEQAAVLLGTRGLRDLAATTAAAGLFESTVNPIVNDLWQHSLGCATVARMLARKVDDVDADEAFLAGLVHDVGKLVMVTLLEEHYDLVEPSLAGQEVCGEETSRYGMHHAELGGECSEDWGLPMEIADAVRFHHDPSAAEESVAMAQVISAANHLSKGWKLGVPGDVDVDIPAVLEAAGLSFDEATLQELEEQAPVKFAESVQTFGRN